LAKQEGGRGGRLYSKFLSFTGRCLFIAPPKELRYLRLQTEMRMDAACSYLGPRKIAMGIMGMFVFSLVFCFAARRIRHVMPGKIAGKPQFLFLYTSMQLCVVFLTAGLLKILTLLGLRIFDCWSSNSDPSRPALEIINFMLNSFSSWCLIDKFWRKPAEKSLTVALSEHPLPRWYHAL